MWVDFGHKLPSLAGFPPCMALLGVRALVADEFLDFVRS